MTDLRQKRLASLNKLLMEQDRPKYAAAIEAGSSEPEASKETKDDDDFLSQVTNTIISLYGIKQARKILIAVIKKAGPEGAELAKALEGGTKASRSARVLSFFRNLGPRGVALSKRIAQETVMTLARRGPSRAVLRRIMLNPSIARFVATRLGISLSFPSGAPIGSATAALATTGGQTAVGAAGAASVAGYVLAGAAVGTAIGIGLNKLFSSPDLDKEVKERLDKAKEDINYAKAELDVYCKGTGALCRDDVDCSGKPGGYEYNKASGYEETLGLGSGRELFGVPGFRTFKQTPMSFHSNDGAVMIGLAFILVQHDLKNGKITLPNEENKLKKAELKQGSVSKEYEDCIKNWLTQSRVMLAQVKKLGMEKAYKELRFVYGIDALPDLPADKEEEAASTAGPTKGNECRGYPFVPGCVGDGINNMIAVLVRGTDEGQRLFQADRDKIQKLADDSVMSPEVIEFVKQVLKVENPKVLADFEAKGNKINSSSDPLAVYVNKLAKEKNISESILTERVKIDPHYVNIIKEQRLRTLNKKLMENKNVIK